MPMEYVGRNNEAEIECDRSNSRGPRIMFLTHRIPNRKGKEPRMIKPLRSIQLNIESVPKWITCHNPFDIPHSQLIAHLKMTKFVKWPEKIQTDPS